MVAMCATNISSNVVALCTLCLIREPGICNAVQASAKLHQAVQDAPFHAMPAEQNSKTPLRVWGPNPFVSTIAISIPSSCVLSGFQLRRTSSSQLLEFSHVICIIKRPLLAGHLSGLLRRLFWCAGSIRRALCGCRCR